MANLHKILVVRRLCKTFFMASNDCAKKAYHALNNMATFATSAELPSGIFMIGFRIGSSGGCPLSTTLYDDVFVLRCIFVLYACTRGCSNTF